MLNVAIVNQKGGSAKTTTAVSLAAALAERQRRVLLVDLDPQGSASAWCGVKTSGREFLETLVDRGEIGSLVQRTSIPFDVIGCGLSFAGLERTVAGEPGAETLLREAISRLPAAWDYILFDCPPSLNVASVNALVAAHGALVPVEAHVLSLEPLARLIDTVQRVQERLNKELRLLGIVACRVDNRTNHGPEVLRLLRERFGDKVYNVSIRENVRVAEAPGFKQPITIYDPQGRGAVDYRQLAAELEQREGASAS
jgi:chromosome partitioning protein